MIENYKDLIVWQKAMDLVEETYRLARKLPASETYALSDQMRRAAVSIPSNIAEGHTRKSAKEYLRFLYIAKGSKSELETQLLIAQRLSFFTSKEAEKAELLCAEVGRMLSSLISKLS